DRPAWRTRRADRLERGARRGARAARHGAGSVRPGNCLDRPRHRHGDGAVRPGLRDADSALRPRRARADHRNHPDRRPRQHGALAAHLPRLLEGAGASEVAAIAAGALVGPAQVGARMVEFGLLRSFHPLISAKIAALLHPIGALFLALLGPSGIAAFAILHGAGNGMITIAKGTLVLALFGPGGYGLRNGILAVPTRMFESLAPLLFGLLIDQ